RRVPHRPRQTRGNAPYRRGPRVLSPTPPHRVPWRLRTACARPPSRRGGTARPVVLPPVVSSERARRRDAGARVSADGRAPVGRAELSLARSGLENARARAAERDPGRSVRRIRRAALVRGIRAPGVARDRARSVARMTISVVIATFNRARMLDECLASLAWQAFHDGDETIVVDNGSHDDTREVIERHRRSWPGRLITCAEPRPGKSIALGTALAAASGEALAFTDDDVDVGDGWLAAIRDAMGDGVTALVGGPVAPRWEAS